MKVAIVGFGYWGPNLVRNFLAHPRVEIAGIVDFNASRLAAARTSYPSIPTFSSLDDALKADPDAIVLATPVATHFELAKQALAAGKHVLVEKPLTNSIKAAEELIRLAGAADRLLMADHTYLYTPAIQKIKRMVDDGTLGKLDYFDSTRINLGLFQKDVNVFWDLATHDISILCYLVGEMPDSVQAIGASHTPNGIENIGYLVLRYASGLIAHFNCSWISPVKIRHILIGGQKKMVLFNDLEPSEKVKIYDTGFNVTTTEQRNELLVDYRVGDVFIPKLDRKEALSNLVDDFVTCAETGRQPLSHMGVARQVVKILSAAEESIRNRGSEIATRE